MNQTDEAVEVYFERSAPRSFDLVIGADGLHSNIRRLAFGGEDEYLRPLGVGLAIFSTPNLLNLRDWQIAYRDAISGYVVYPTRDNGELRANFGFGLTMEDYPRGDLAAQKQLVAKGVRICAATRQNYSPSWAK